MISSIILAILAMFQPEAIDQAVEHASSSSLIGSSGALIEEEEAIAWASEPISNQTVTQKGWESRLRLKAERKLVTQVAMKLAMSMPGHTIEEEQVLESISPTIQQRGGMSLDRRWVALSCPIPSRVHRVKIKADQAVQDQEKLTLAILPFKEIGPDPQTGIGKLAAASMLSAIDSPNITLIERDEIARILDAREFSKLDVTEDGTGMFIGRLMNARYLLMGTIGRGGPGEWILTGRIIDTTTGEIVEGHRGAVSIFSSGQSMVDGTRALALEMGLRSPEGEKPEPVELHEPAESGTVESMVRAVPRGGPNPLTLQMNPVQAAYEEGQSVHFQIHTKKAGYLTMLMIGADGKIVTLVPNPEARSVYLEAGESLSIPTLAMRFYFLIQPPHGLARIKAFITDEPLVIPGSFDDHRKDLLQLVRTGRIGGEGDSPLNTSEWASAEIQFLTRESAPEKPVNR
ncbi:MAG: DUF4384 domain-containing protein [Phycisphaerales bacterium]|nr:DUF4384 domain-containing protein [Phycisphaerales bacterium]